MPDLNKFGTRLLTAAADARKLVAIPAAQRTAPVIQADQWARNGLNPDARLVNSLNEAANQAALYRTKEVFRALGTIRLLSIVASYGAGDRARYRFAFRSGPYTHALGAIVGMVPQGSGQNQNSYARLDIANGAGSVVASQTFVYGASPIGTAGSNQGWMHLKQIIGSVTGLSPDTEYYGTFYDVDYGRIQSACVFELASLTENFNGYLPQNLTNKSAVLNVYREYLATISNALWQKGGAQVFTWTVDDGTAPQTRASGTLANLLDTSVTTVSATSPGYTLDMTGKARVSQSSGVPVTMKVFAGSSGGGDIRLVNSAGTTVMQINAGWIGTPAWQSVTGYLPASADKYDLRFSNNGSGTFSVYAVSVYEYG